MYSKADIIKKLSNEGQFIDNFILDAFIKNWHIDPIYEDENGVEFFDDASYANIKSLMTQRNNLDKNKFNNINSESLSSLSCSNDKMEKEKEKENNNNDNNDIICNNNQKIIEKIPVSKNKTNLNNKDNALKLNKYEIEIKSIDALTNNIACKITKEFENFLKESSFINDLLQSSECKNDNKYLASKIRKIVKENLALKEKIKELKADNQKYIKVFGNFYIKQKM